MTVPDWVVWLAGLGFAPLLGWAVWMTHKVIRLAQSVFGNGGRGELQRLDEEVNRLRERIHKATPRKDGGPGNLVDDVTDVLLRVEAIERGLTLRRRK